jgi:hypothetical protein
MLRDDITAAAIRRTQRTVLRDDITAAAIRRTQRTVLRNLLVRLQTAICRNYADAKRQSNYRLNCSAFQLSPPLLALDFYT